MTTLRTEIPEDKTHLETLYAKVILIMLQTIKPITEFPVDFVSECFRPFINGQKKASSTNLVINMDGKLGGWGSKSTILVAKENPDIHV